MDKHNKIQRKQVTGKCIIAIVLVTISLYCVPDRITASESYSRQMLNALDWMIGSWEFEMDFLHIESQIERSASGNYILCSDTARAINGDLLYHELRIIAYNPISELFESWIFRENGGFGSAIIEEFGHDWVVPTKMILADGRTTTAVNTLTPIASGGFLWKSSSRTLNGLPLPEFGPVLAKPVVSDKKNIPLL